VRSKPKAGSTPAATAAVEATCQASYTAGLMDKRCMRMYHVCINWILHSSILL
jgi:hypothetical protein